MNQLHKRFFKIQLLLSITVLVFLLCFGMYEWRQEKKLQKVSQVINQAFEIETVYEAQKTMLVSNVNHNQYFGKITIPKIDLEYSVFNECNDELLKILPCKFYGVNLGEKGNICIAGHNYHDTRFFSRLNKLKVGDFIYLGDLKGKNYPYVVYDKYSVKPDDFECLKPRKSYDLTLLTCDYTNEKRFIIKAEKY